MLAGVVPHVLEAGPRDGHFGVGPIEVIVDALFVKKVGVLVSSVQLPLVGVFSRLQGAQSAQGVRGGEPQCMISLSRGPWEENHKDGGKRQEAIMSDCT